ncbi:hypothetical protein [Salinirussus salinus]|uniref:hypothetical protein n=1 Tax=Salinirussus salinus TaxID=1198300 RepID=UPI00135B0F91|nr:hypothetical protein [Salinirussus salinus]
MSADERIAQHAAAGLTRAVDPDASRHFQAILELVDIETPTPLMECPVCGCAGLPERIHAHECTQNRGEE